MKDMGEASVILEVKIIRKGDSNTLRNFLRSLVTMTLTQ